MIKMTKTTKTAVSEPAEYLIFAAATKNMPVFAKNTERKHLQKPKKFRLKAIQKNCILKTSVSQRSEEKRKTSLKELKRNAKKLNRSLQRLTEDFRAMRRAITQLFQSCAQKRTLLKNGLWSFTRL